MEIARALNQSPMNTTYHVRFAELLAALAMNGAASEYMRQAQMLGVRPKKLKRLSKHFAQIESTDPSLNVYFVSWNGDPTPGEISTMCCSAALDSAHYVE